LVIGTLIINIRIGAAEMEPELMRILEGLKSALRDYTNEEIVDKFENAVMAFETSTDRFDLVTIEYKILKAELLSRLR
jgi:ATP/maltotriose-dependent transcriptional regulator MalT